MSWTNYTTQLGVPPIPYLQLLAMRYPNGAQNSPEYYSDCDWFSKHKRRTITIRASAFDFKEPEFIGNPNRPPKLHCLIVQTSPGFHLVFPIFRGNAVAWPTESFAQAHYVVANSDGDLWNLLMIVVKAGGMSPEAHAQYLAHVKRCGEIADEQDTAAALAALDGPGKVN